MSDIETRLTEYAERWRATQPALPMPHVRTRRAWFNWAAIGATAAVAAGLVVGITLTVRDTHQVVHPANTPWLSYDVPWVNRVAPQASPDLTQTVHALPCRAKGLIVGYDKYSIGMSHSTTYISFVNTGPQVCSLIGHPHVLAYLANGGTASIPYESGHAELEPTKNIAVGQSTDLGISTLSCSPTGATPSSLRATRIVASLPAGGGELALPISPGVALCDKSIAMSASGFGRLLGSSTTPLCRGSALHVANVGGNGAGGFSMQDFALVNASRATCRIQGVYPTVRAHLTNGRTFTGTDGGGFVNDPKPVAANDIAAGQRTVFEVSIQTACDTHQSRAIDRLTARLPWNGDVVVLARGGYACGPIEVGRLGAFRAAPIIPTYSLTASINLPPTVRAGATLDYVVTLTASTTDVPLVPCPGYTEQAVGPPLVNAFALNCDRVQTIRVGQPIRYEMRLPIPASTPSGPVGVLWELNATDGASAIGTVTITR